MEKYILGLDVGIASVGWSIVEIDDNNKPKKIKDLGVRIFKAGENAQTGESLNLNRREKRGTRRLIRRRSFRLDRVRDLLYTSNFFDFKINNQIYSLYLDELKEKVENEINKYYSGKSTNPFLLKVKALDEKLTNIELAIILLHYAKYRGFKSNRSNDDLIDEDSNENTEENKIVKKNIEENRKLLSNYRSVSEMFVKDIKFKDRIHNESGDYKTSVSREMYKKEIETVLDTQISKGLIDENFKEKYLKIWSSQRDFSEGPGGDSKYGGNLIEKNTGKCLFDGEPRAPKLAPSSELFSVLQKLVNFRYYDENNVLKSLTKEQIELILNNLLQSTTGQLSYKQIKKVLNINNLKIKDLSLSKKEYTKILNEFKTKSLGLNKEDKVIIEKLDSEQVEEFNNLKNEKLLSKTFIEMKTYSILKKQYIKCFGSEEWEKVKDNFELFDNIATILTNYKTDQKIKENIEKNNVIKNIDIDLNDYILSLPNFKDHISLSLSMLYKLIPLLKEGYRYDQAMEKLGYNHSDMYSSSEKYDLMRPVTVGTNIKNGRVIRSLTQTRKVINQIINKYGLPYQINIEVARELAKTKKERNEIKEIQLENKNKNDLIKEQIFNNFPHIFKSIDKVSQTDILKYKLWIEQDEMCMYSLTKIKPEELFEDNYTQIDHILPYSRTYDDSYFNKTLVKTYVNQNKGNRTPYEWLKNLSSSTKNHISWDEYKANVLNSNKISLKKKEYYLNTKLGEEEENEFKERNLVDTQSIATTLSNILRKDLNVNSIKTINGAVIGRLRSRWGLNNLTHSIESENYIKKNENSEGTDEDKKNRDNHLHHALDACIIAVTNDSLIQKITKYEKYKKYIKSIGKIYKDLNDIADKIIFYDEKTGEVLLEEETKKELKEFVKEGLDEKFLINDNNKKIKMYFPTPYKEFIDEVKVRTYEQDTEKYKIKLKELGIYDDKELSSLTPIIPSIAKNKVSGTLHMETYYGIKEKEINNEIVKVAIERINVNSSKFTKEKLEKIVDKNSGSKEVYESIKEWIANYKNGEEAFKAKNSYPINKKTGNVIKKIRIEDSVFDNKGHILNNNKIVKIDTIAKIEIYKNKNEKDNKLYFAGIDLLSIYKREATANETMITLWYGQNSNNLILNYIELQNNYNLIETLNKYDIVEIELKNSRKGKCFIIGFSSGKIEVGSILGDGSDITGDNNLFAKKQDRYYLTVSTIKEITKLKINVLGKIG